MTFLPCKESVLDGNERTAYQRGTLRR
jgi:hypothetical protein